MLKTNRWWARQNPPSWPRSFAFGSEPFMPSGLAVSADFRSAPVAHSEPPPVRPAAYKWTALNRNKHLTWAIRCRTEACVCLCGGRGAGGDIVCVCKSLTRYVTVCEGFVLNQCWISDRADETGNAAAFELDSTLRAANGIEPSACVAHRHRLAARTTNPGACAWAREDESGCLLVGLGEDF